jgi:beta-lactamase regulating signal transducer with metallopeptidase domain
MSGVAALLEHPVVLKLGLALLHFLWQGAALAVVASALLLALRRARPAARYLALLVVLAAMAAAPVVTFLALPELPASMPLSAAIQTSAPAQPAAPATSLPPASPVGGSGSSAATPPSPDERPHPSLASRLTQARAWLEARLAWVAAGWVIGVFVLSLRLLLGWIGVARARRRGVEPAGEQWQAVLATLAERLRVSRPVRLLESAAAQVPTLIGWLRPVVLLPASALSGLTPAQIEALIAHELAHVRRGDYLVNVLQTVIETLLFYHPAVWWVSSRIRAEREHCCDDLAVACCGDAVAYARALADLEHLRSAPQPALGAHGGSLVPRIRRLVGLSAPPCKRASWLAGALAIAGIVAVGAGVTVAARTPNEPRAGTVTQAIAALEEALAAGAGTETTGWGEQFQIVQGLLKVDVQAALSVARSIRDPYSRGLTLGFMTGKLAETDPARALAVANETLEVAQEVPAEANLGANRSQVMAGIVGIIERSDPERALDVVRTMTNPVYRGSSLALLAKRYAPRDPDRAKQLEAEAIDVAEKARTGPLGDGFALENVSLALVGLDTDKAVEIAQGLNAHYRDLAFRNIAEMLAKTDPVKAATVAASIKDGQMRSEGLWLIAASLAKTDTEKALSVARTIPVGYYRISSGTHRAGEPDIALAYYRAAGLCCVAAALAKTDPARGRQIADEALGVARAIENRHERNSALSNVLRRLAGIEPDKVLEVARSATDPRERGSILAGVARGLAEAGNLDRALEIARSIAEPASRASALTCVAEALAEKDPERSRQAAQEAWKAIRGVEGNRSHNLSYLAGVMAKTDPDAAMHIARTIRDEFWRARALQNAAFAILARTGGPIAITIPKEVTEAGKERMAVARGYFAYLRDGRLAEAKALATFSNREVEAAWEQQVRDYAKRLKAGGTKWWGDVEEIRLAFGPGPGVWAAPVVQWRHHSRRGWVDGPRYTYTMRTVDGKWKMVISRRYPEGEVPWVPADQP